MLQDDAGRLGDGETEVVTDADGPRSAGPIGAAALRSGPRAGRPKTVHIVGLAV